MEVLALVSSVAHSHLEESAGGVVGEVVGVGLVCSFLGVSLGFLMLVPADHCVCKGQHSTFDDS